jgi:integrase
MTVPVEMPFVEWPETDRKLWQSMIEPKSSFLDDSRVARWAPRTLEEARKSYGLWLQWLGARGLLNNDLTPLDRATEENLLQFVIAERQRVALSTISTRLFHLIGVFESLDPTLNARWDWLRRLRSKLKRRAAKQPRKRPHLVHARRIFDWSISMMQQAISVDGAGTVDVDLYLDGLIAALLISIPLRIDNFTSLRLGEQVRRIDGRWVVLIDRAETKTGQVVACPLPATLTPWIDRYVYGFRSQLVARRFPPQQDNRAFWIGLEGRPVQSQTLRKRIKRRTAAAFGKEILPHSFRKIARTTFMVERPEYGAYAPALLGHRSAEAMEKHYFIAQGQLAVETYHELDRRSRLRSAGVEHVKSAADLSFDRKLRAFVVGAGHSPGRRR